MADQKWQWHYAASEFVAQGPITICGLAVRAASGGGGVAGFDFPSLTVTMATAVTTYGAGTHHAVFSSNLGSDAAAVHSGRWAGGPVPSAGTPVASCIDIPLAQPFVFDPSAGDFIIQLETCGTTVHWGALLEGRHFVHTRKLLLDRNPRSTDVEGDRRWRTQGRVQAG